MPYIAKIRRHIAYTRRHILYNQSKITLGLGNNPNSFGDSINNGEDREAARGRTIDLSELNSLLA